MRTMPPEGDSMRDADGECGREPAAAAMKPKQIVKEGLSEYFIYTIEGTETIPNGWSKRMRSFEAADGPVQNPVPLSARRSTASNSCGCTC